MINMPAGAVIVSVESGEALMSTGNAWVFVTPRQGPFIPVAEDIFRAAAKTVSHG